MENNLHCVPLLSPKCNWLAPFLVPLLTLPQSAVSKLSSIFHSMSMRCHLLTDFSHISHFTDWLPRRWVLGWMEATPTSSWGWSPASAPGTRGPVPWPQSGGCRWDIKLASYWLRQITWPENWPLIGQLSGGAWFLFNISLFAVEMSQYLMVFDLSAPLCLAMTTHNVRYVQYPAIPLLISPHHCITCPLSWKSWLYHCGPHTGNQTREKEEDLENASNVPWFISSLRPSLVACVILECISLSGKQNIMTLWRVNVSH